MYEKNIGVVTGPCKIRFIPFDGSIPIEFNAYTIRAGNKIYIGTVGREIDRVPEINDQVRFRVSEEPYKKPGFPLVHNRLAEITAVMPANPA